MKRLATLAAALALSAFAQSANAGLLNDEVKATYHFPSLEANYANLGQGVVDADGLTFDGIGLFDLTVSDRRITIDYKITSYWTPTSYNGFALTDLSKALPALKLGAGTNMDGFGTDNFWVYDNILFVNWQGLSFNTDTLVVLDLVEAPAQVPEPLSLGLLGLGLAGIAASRRLRK